MTQTMTILKSFGFLCIWWLLAPLAAAQDLDRTALAQQANADLDVMSRELAKLAATPGFRGFLRSEIARSKNRESILELDAFLDRAAGQRGMPPGLSQFREVSRQARGRLKAGGADLRGYDLYIPVEAHRAKWKGGQDFVVAFAPVGDDQSVQQIVAYSVRDGGRVILDATRPPEQVVLIIAPEEHQTHEALGAPVPVTEADRQLHKPDVVGREPPEIPVAQSEGNSFVGIRRMYIRDLKEPWWMGAPEVYAGIAQRDGNYCAEGSLYTSSRSLELLDQPATWRTTWIPGQNSDCQQSDKNRLSERTCWYFDSGYHNKMRLYIYERDWSLLSYNRPIVFDLYDGVSCSIHRGSDDDYIDHGTMYRSNFNFEYDLHQELGNANVIWHKVH